MLSSGPTESGHTLAVDFLECTKIALVQICLPRKRRKVVSEQLPNHRNQCTMGRKKGRIIEDKIGLICA